MQVKLSAHGAYRHQYHIVWIPKYRRKVLVNEIKAYVEKCINEISEHRPDVQVVKINVQLDHVHLIAEIPPRYSIAEIVEKMKQNSSRKVGKKIKGEILWSPGYFSSTVGMDEKEIMK